MTTQTCFPCESIARPHGYSDRKLVHRPAIDVIQHETGIDLVVDLPGVNQDHVDLTLEKGTLTVTGQRPARVEGNDVYREIHSGEYRRVFSLSDDVDTDGISADMQDGVLLVHLPKVAQAQPRRIDIAGA